MTDNSETQTGFVIKTLGRNEKSIPKTRSLGLLFILKLAETCMISEEKFWNEQATVSRPVEDVGHDLAAHHSLLTESGGECPHHSL